MGDVNDERMESNELERQTLVFAECLWETALLPPPSHGRARKIHEYERQERVIVSRYKSRARKAEPSKILCAVQPVGQVDVEGANPNIPRAQRQQKKEAREEDGSRCWPLGA